MPQSNISDDSPHIESPPIDPDTLSVISADLENPAELERKIFTAINDGNRDALQHIFQKFPSSTEILSLLLTTTYQNTQGTYKHDPEVISDAEELLGDSLEHLNAIQIACLLGDDEIASDILDFVHSVTEEIEARKVLYEFMGRVWGNGNTVLHLASFLGMSDLVKRLIELGANPNKKNERNYKPVDCADDDRTRNMFNTVTEVIRPSNRSSTDDPKSTSIGGKIRQSPSVEEFLGAPTRYLKTDLVRLKSDKISLLEGLSISPASGGGTVLRHSKSLSLDDGKPVSSAMKEGSGMKRSASMKAPMTLGGGSISPSISNIALAESSINVTTNTPTVPSQTCTPTPAWPVPRFLKRVTFSPSTLLLDMCQHGDVGDPTGLTTIKACLGLIPTSSSPGLKSIMGPKAPPGFAPVNLEEVYSPHQWLTPLHIACTHGRIDIVEILLRDANSPVNIRDKEGWTALHCACAEGHLEAIRMLCKAQGVYNKDTGEKVGEGDVYFPVDGPVEMEPVNEDGETPDDVAFESKAKEIRRFLDETRRKYPPKEIDEDKDEEEENVREGDEDDEDEEEDEEEEEEVFVPAPPIKRSGIMPKPALRSSSSFIFMPESQLAEPQVIVAPTTVHMSTPIVSHFEKVHLESLPSTVIEEESPTYSGEFNASIEAVECIGSEVDAVQAIHRETPVELPLTETSTQSRVDDIVETPLKNSDVDIIEGSSTTLADVNLRIDAVKPSRMTNEASHLSPEADIDDALMAFETEAIPNPINQYLTSISKQPLPSEPDEVTESVETLAISRKSSETDNLNPSGSSTPKETSGGSTARLIAEFNRMSASNSAATSPTRKPSNAKPLSPKESLFSTEPPTSQQEPCLRTPTRRYSAAKTIAEHSLKVETADRRNSGVQESPLLLPSQITSASTSASRKEDAKKNRSHRLSETTSGHFAVWMNQNEATSPGDGSARSPKSNRRWSRDAGSLMSGAGSMSPTREQPEIFVGSRGRSILDTQKRTAQISPTRGTFSVLSDGSRDAFGSESSLATDTSLRRSPSPSSLGAPPAPVRLQRATSSPVTLRPQLGLHNKSSPESHQRAESESVKPDTPNRDLAPLFKHSATSGGFGKSGGIGVGWSIRVGTMKAPSVVKPTDAKNDGQNGKTTGANSKPAEGGLGFFGKRSTRK